MIWLEAIEYNLSSVAFIMVSRGAQVRVLGGTTSQTAFSRPGKCDLVCGQGCKVLIALRLNHKTTNH